MSTAMTVRIWWVANDYACGSQPGLRVFSHPSLVNTCRLWNQHSYHITNIKEDGSVPAVEEPSWLRHNTYRLNTFPDRDPREGADLTAGALTILDHGTGQPLSLQVRLGNAGGLTPSQPVTVAFSQGAPGQGGVRLGTVTLPPLAGGQGQTVRLDGVTLGGTADLYAVVDPEQRLTECHEDNNTVTVPLTSAAPLGQMAAVATDAAAYGPQSPVELTATLTNTGSLPVAYVARFHIEDSAGAPVVTFAPLAVPTLAGGASMTLSQVWNTGTVLAGMYRAVGTLFDPAGQPLSEARAAFAINADATALVALRTSTDRQAYHTSGTMALTTLVRNLTTNLLLPGTTVQVQVHDPQGQAVFSTTLAVGDLEPQGQREVRTTYAFQASPEGPYVLTTRWFDGTATLLATSQATFAIAEQAALALTGSVTLQAPRVERGQAQTCTATVTNRGTRPVGAQALRQVVVGMESQQVVRSDERTVTLAPGASQTLPQTFSTGQMAAGPYACVLQANIAGAWQTLASGLFEVEVPPVQIAATFATGPRGRVLVLLDPLTPACRSEHDDRDDEEDYDEEEGHDEEDHDTSCGDAQHNDDDAAAPGAAGVPTGAAQHTFLEAMLRQSGWSATLTTDATSFTRAFRSGGYATYLVLAARVKLAEQVQDELREAVYRGEGLIVAGTHDQRNGRLAEPLGIKAHGKASHAQRLVLAATALHPAGEASLALPDSATQAELAGATSAGTFVPARGGSRPAVAVAMQAYGQGRAVYAGFDLLGEATLAGADSLFAGLLRQALASVHPGELSARSGAVLPVRVTLTNRGSATPGQVVVIPPPATAVVEAQASHGLVLLQPGGTLPWLWTLGEGATETLTVWLRLPETPGALTLEAVVQSGQGAALTELQRLQLPLTVTAPPTLAAVTARVPASKAYRPVREALSQAERSLSRGDRDKALAALLKAAEELQRLATPEAAELRLLVGQVLWAVAPQVAGR